MEHISRGFERIGVAVIIATFVRTFLSFSLDVEIEGRLPWRRPELPESGETR